MGSDPALSYTDEEMLRRLLGNLLWEELDRLGVRPRLVIEAKDEQVDLQRVGAELEERAIVLGSVRKRQDRLAALGVMAASAAHELRNIVGGIIGLSEVALDRVERKRDVAAVLRRIKTEAETSAHQLTNRLDFARVTAAPPGPINVNALIEDVAALVRHQLITSGIRLVLELDDTVPSALGHRGDVRHILVNLVLNAQQAMIEGGVVRIASSQGEDGTVIVRVSDTGPGVPEDLRERVFESMFTTRGATQGTGLGLSISARLAEDMGATLHLEDVQDGASFALTLRPAT